MINQEIYAIVEMNNLGLNYVVATYDKNQIKLLYKKQIEQKLCHNGVVIDEKHCAKLLSTIIKESNKQLNIEIKRVGLTLPNDCLQVKTVNKTMVFPIAKVIIPHDLNHLFEQLQNSDDKKNDETVCFIRPYRYKVNDQQEYEQPPVGMLVNKLAVKTLVYTTKTAIKLSQENIVNSLKLQALTSIPYPFALGWNVATKQQFKQGVTIVDWNYDQINVNVYTRESLCYQYTIEGSISIIINELKKQLHCNEQLAKKYLFKIINLASSKNTTIIYRKYLADEKKTLEFSMFDLQRIVNEKVYLSIQQINKFLNDKLTQRSYPIIYTGIILNVAGFKRLAQEFTKTVKNQSIEFYLPKTLAGQYSWISNLLGNVYYQHYNNLINNTYVYSIEYDHAYKQLNNKTQLVNNNNVNLNNTNVGNPSFVSANQHYHNHLVQKENNGADLTKYWGFSSNKY